MLNFSNSIRKKVLFLIIIKRTMMEIGVRQDHVPMAICMKWLPALLFLNWAGSGCGFHSHRMDEA